MENIFYIQKYLTDNISNEKVYQISKIKKKP